MTTTSARRLAASLASAALAACWLLGAAAFGQGTYSWNTTSGTWDITTANWIGSGTTWVDGTSSNAVFNNTTGQTVTISGSISAANVSFGDTTGATTNNSWTLSSGTLTTAGNLAYQGSSSNGGNYGTNPTLAINSNVNVAGSTLIGRANFTINGGTFTTNRITTNPASADWARFLMFGGSVTATNGVDGTYGTTGSNGTGATFDMLLQGGTLSTTYIKVADREVGGNNYAWLTFNGTIVRALTSTSSFIQTYGGGNNAFIAASGAYLDSNGFDITVSPSLVNYPGQTGFVVKQGGGTLTLSGSNSFSGGTTVSGGRLSVGNTNALGTATATVNGGTLDLAGFTVSNAITLSSGTLLGTAGTTGVGAIAVSGGVIDRSSGTLNAAAVTIGTTGANPTTTSPLAGTGRLAASSFVVQGNNINGAGAGTGSPVTISSGTLTTSGNLGVGRWALTLGGSSTVTVSGTIGGSGISLSPDWGTLTIQDNAVVTATGGVAGNTEAWQLNLNGGTLSTPSIQASDRETGGAARLVFNGTRVIATASNASFVTVGANSGATNSALVGNGGVDIDSNGFNVGIGVNLRPDTSSTGGLTKRGAGTLTLSGANTYAGTTSVSAGRLLLSGSGTIGTGPLAVNTGAALDLGTTTQTLGGVLNNSGTGNGAVGAITNGTINLNGRNAYLQSGTFTMNLTGGGFSRLWIGGDANATVELGGNNTSTYADSNSTIIGLNGGVGTVKLLSATALGPSGQNTQVHSGTLDLNGQTGITVSSIMLNNGNMANSNTGTAASYAGTVTFNGTTTPQIGGAGDITLSGNLTNGGFTKTGAGTLNLTGANTYTGSTTVSAGGLRVNGSLGSGGVSVAQGAVLSGTGSIAGAVNVLGTLSPGNSPGVITLGSLVLGGTSTTLIEFTNSTVRGTGYDGIDISTASGLTYGGLLSLTFGNSSSFADNTTFDIFAFTGSTAGAFTSVTSTGYYSGTWASVGSGNFELVSGGQTLTFSQATGDIIVVPEPATLALAGLGGLLAAVALRRRARKM